MFHRTIARVLSNNCRCFIKQLGDRKADQLLYRTIQRKPAVVSPKSCSFFLEGLQLYHQTTVVVSPNNCNCSCWTKQLQLTTTAVASNNCSSFIFIEELQFFHKTIGGLSADTSSNNSSCYTEILPLFCRTTAAVRCAINNSTNNHGRFLRLEQLQLVSSHISCCFIEQQ